MARLIDLRKYFGIWKRCGNTRFFMKDTNNPRIRIFLNPLDGVVITILRPLLDKPLYDITVRDAEKADNEDIAKTFKDNAPFPWIERAVKRFFYHQALGWALDALREYTGKDPLPGDKDMGNFLSLYVAGGSHYESEGGLPPGGDWDKPLLEETLQAVLTTITGTPKTIVDVGKNLSDADVEEALAERGILEC
jgi:hypothetical protein